MHRFTALLRITALTAIVIVVFALITHSGIAADEPVSQLARSMTAVRVDQAPVIDGSLSDPCWQTAAFQGEFHRQGDPDRGGPARVPTRFAVAYDDECLYIAAEMRGEDPEKLLRSITRRDDNLDQDDTVCLYIDSFLDYRSAYFFQVNAIGTQRDIYSTANGQQTDIGWDGVWDAAARVQADGWTAEFRIPFRILRFNWSENMTWGFDIVRISKQREDFSEWNYVEMNQQNTLDPRYYGTITGLKNVKKPLMLQFISSVVGSSSQVNRAVIPPAEETGWDTDEELDGGLDVIWGITPTMTLTATINPDFAQIEADPDQINLNGEELLLQERRPFFRENSAIFRVPDSEYPFYSRRISDISQGLRLNGQTAGSDLAVLVVNGEDNMREDNLFGVLRSQTPVTRNLTVSGWFVGKFSTETPYREYTNRHGEYFDTVDDDYNILAGLDASYRPGNWLVNMHLYRTWYPDEMRNWHTDRPTDETENIHVKCRYSGQQWLSLTDYTDLAMGYYQEMGFTNVSRLGQRMLMQYFWKEITFDEDHVLNEISGNAHVLGAYNRNDSSHWSVLGCNANARVEFDNRIAVSVTGELYDDRSFYKFNRFTTDENGQIISGTARYYANTLGRGNNRVRTLDIGLEWTDGGFQGAGVALFTGDYYFSRLRQWNIWANWSCRQAFTAQLSLDHLERFDPTDEYRAAYGGWTDWDVWIYRGKFMYFFNRDLYTRLIVSGYLDEDRRFNRHGISALVAWEYLPGSHLYCVYESNWLPYDFQNDTLLGLDEMEHSDQLFYIKLSYMLSL